jgi:hypothetical protein
MNDLEKSQNTHPLHEAEARDQKLTAEGIHAVF